MENCPDCFKEVKSRADIYKQVKENAQTLAQKTLIAVAVIATGPGFTFETITNGVPGGTVEIVTPLRRG